MEDFDNVALTPGDGWYASNKLGMEPIAVWSIRSGRDPMGWVSGTNELIPAWKTNGFNGYVRVPTPTTIPAQPGWVAVFSDGTTRPVIAWVQDTDGNHIGFDDTTPNIAMRPLCPAKDISWHYSSQMDTWEDATLVSFRFDMAAYSQPFTPGADLEEVAS